MDGMMMTDFSDPDEYYAMFKEIRDRALLGDSEGLPAESFEDFSEMPLTFEEMTAGMRDDLEQLYTLTGTVNRYSADYPVLCRQLERMIKRVGLQFTELPHPGSPPVCILSELYTSICHHCKTPPPCLRSISRQIADTFICCGVLINTFVHS